MALLAGSVSINGAGVASGSGLALALYNALQSAYAVSPAQVPNNVPGAQQQLAVIANVFAQTTVAHIIANAVVSVTVASGIAVSTTGTAAAQTGATTATGSGTGTIA